jgi:hypothetical protein
MPEVTFSFDAPLEANRVSNEDTRAQLDDGSSPTTRRQTLDALRKAERYWGAFSQGCVQAEPLLLTGAGTTYTSTLTTRSLSSARNPLCT